MGQAEDFIRSLLENNPMAKSGRLTLDQLNTLIGEHAQKLNNAPKDDFDGISPNQMHILLHNALSSECALQYGEHIEEYLDRIPLFKLLELLISTIEGARSLKLTQRGNLPVKICKLLFDQQLIRWPHMHLSRMLEEEIPFLPPLKHYLLDQALVKKRNNGLSLTKKGERRLYDEDFDRFASFLNYFTGRFNWQNFYRIEDGGKCGQLGWAYSLLMLSRYGDLPRESRFYSAKCMQAFEPELYKQRDNKEFAEATSRYHHCFKSRFFESFADWFGLVTIERRKNPAVSIFGELMITKTPLFDQVFQEIRPK